MSNKNKTPLLRPLRKEGGTLYIFPSATEDIGLNINSRANRVALSYYALLDIPNCETYDDIISGQDPDIWIDSSSREDYLNKNRFMPGLIPGRFTNTGQDQIDRSETGIGSWEIAASLQNYAMNFETVLRNQDSYNYQLSKTVSERVFWKWLKETGAIRWEYIKDLKTNPDGSEIKKGYYREVSDSASYERVVKCFGEIAAGNSLSTEFGMFNEIYITVPSSYGESPIYFQIDEDDNYQLGKAYTSNELQNNILEGRREYMNNNIIDFQYTLNRAWSDVYQESANMVDPTRGKIETENGLPWYKDLYNNEGDINSYITDDAITDYTKPLDVSLYVTPPGENSESSFIVKRSKLDAVSLVKSIPVYENIMKSQLTDNITENTESEFSSLDYPIEYIEDGLLDWDKLAIDFHKNIDSKFTFNTVLLYYTVYDANNQTELATNLFGILFLDGVKDEQGSESSDFSGANMQFSFNEIIKRQSNENGFGTGYSFRVNIKTSSVFDNTDALISDNTTANSIITDNFNDVIYSLHQSLNLMQGNTYITQSLIDKYNELHAHVQNNDLDIRKLKTDLNTYLMYKYENIVADTIDSDLISVRTIVPNSLNEVKSSGSTLNSIDFNFYRNNPDTSAYILSDAPIMSVGINNVNIKHSTAEKLKVHNLYQSIPWVYGNTMNEDYIEISDPVLDNALTILEAIDIKLLQDTNTWVTEDWDNTLSEWVKTVHDGTEQYYIIDPSSSLFTERNTWGYKSDMIYTDYTSGITWVNYQKFIPLIILTLKKLLTYHKTGVSAETELSSKMEQKFGEWIEKGETTLSTITEEAQNIVNSHAERLIQYSNIIDQNRAEIINQTVDDIAADVSAMVERDVSIKINQIVDSSVPDNLWNFVISEKVSELVDNKIDQRFPRSAETAQAVDLETMSTNLTNLNNALSILQSTFNTFSNNLANMNVHDSGTAISTIVNAGAEASGQLENIQQYMHQIPIDYSDISTAIDSSSVIIDASHGEPVNP